MLFVVTGVFCGYSPETSDARDGDRFAMLSHGVEHKDTDGPLYSIDLNSGKLNWSYEFETAWGITINQPPGSPLLILTRRNRSLNAPQSGNGALTLDLLAIDTRTGQAAVRVDGFVVESNFNNIGTETTILSDRNLVDVAVQRYAFLFEFSDQEVGELPLVYDSEAIEEMHAEAEKSADEAYGRPAIGRQDIDNR